MASDLHQLGDCRFELLQDRDTFRGIGKVWIGDTLIRSGRLPWRPDCTTYQGLELCRLRSRDVVSTADELRIRLWADFRRATVQGLRDHSFDPILDLQDWGADPVVATAALDWVLRPATDSFNDVDFGGFSFCYEYDGSAATTPGGETTEVPVFWLYDRCSWELEGDILGATAISQSSCSDPVARFAQDTAWTTEGIIHWADAKSKANPVMTHNLPRWASHGSFDYQYKGDLTLIGVFAKVDLIRSVLRREAGKPELKTFDKYIFDQTTRHTTTAKAILLRREPRSEVGQQNLWTWVQDEVYARARAEFGLAEEPVLPYLAHNYWHDFTIDTYYRDLLPAAAACGFRALFIDNVNKSAMTERCPSEEFHWNMCCGHEYEPAPFLGGPQKLKEFTERCAEFGITPWSWTNNDQSHSSPIGFHNANTGKDHWFVLMECARLRYGGAYGDVFAILNFSREEPRRYWIDCLKKNRAECGLKGYLFDSFYNLGFMPVDYRDCTPTTIWRGLLAAFKELQDADVHFRIESFGPFGEVQHGCPQSYGLPNLFACYKIGLGTGYTTVPTGQEKPRPTPWPEDDYFRILASMANPGHRLFYGGVRIDRLFSEEHKRILREYYEYQPAMGRRYLQEDGEGILWHDAEGTVATLWNFSERRIALPGTVRDLSTGQELAPSDSYRLLPRHVYRIGGVDPLPTRVG